MENIYFIILSIVIIIYILISVRKNKLSIKTSFLWIMASIHWRYKNMGLPDMFTVIYTDEMINKWLGVKSQPSEEKKNDYSEVKNND